MKLIYVADPMCSWCYGFGAPMDSLLSEPGSATPLELAVVMGGLRPFTREPLSPGKADEIFGHWHHVHEASGQPFAAAPSTALHEAGFIYDTEPASRAVVTVRSHWPQHTWRYLKAVQRAFYADAQNVTRLPVLADIAEANGLPREAFEAAFESPAMREATLADFAQSQAWGIRGFPALIAEHGDELRLVSSGYLGVGALRDKLAAVQAAGR
ncbi:MAG: DsbA family protein [Pseudomonadota bacterium]|nr:DsbA family protein [Pseudomonadota bacterium]